MMRRLSTGSCHRDYSRFGNGKINLVVGLVRLLTRVNTRGRFFHVIDLVNQLETEQREGGIGRWVDQSNQCRFVVLDELIFLPFAPLEDSCCFI